MSIVVTAASGRLGKLVVQNLLARIEPSQVVALVRDPSRASDLTRAGVELRVVDYNDEASLARAFHRGDKVLLIASAELGRRPAQHAAVMQAAKRADTSLFAYTSMLQADRASFHGAQDHIESERALLASGLPYVVLRNGWYNESYTDSLPATLAIGAVVSSADNGAIATATRDDYATAASIVLTTPGHHNTTYELSGDRAWTLGEYAAEVSKQTGKPISYAPLQATRYRDILIGAGLSTQRAEAIADSDLAIARGELAATPGHLRRLLGRATTPIALSIATALKGLETRA